MSKNKNKKRREIYKEKGTILRARREEIIKFLVDKNVTLVPEYFKPEYRILFDTFQGL